MPNLNKTEIAVIMDRSGSMGAIQKDMEGGFVSFVAEQMKEPGELVVSLYQFDDKFDVVFQERPAVDVKTVELVPRGWTALYDAVGKATVMIGERLAKKPEAERPGCVIVLVITDGEENRSREYTKERVREMIKHQEEAYNWRFAYLGASKAGLEQDGAIFTSAAVASFDANSLDVASAYQDTGKAIGNYRANIRSNNLSAPLGIAASRNRSDK